MIYMTIRCKNDDFLIYVGSTIQPLFKRWFQHKSKVNTEKSTQYNYFLYQKMRETNIEDWYIELYEDCSCENKEQLNRREGEIIREIGTLNKNIAGRTHKECVKKYIMKLIKIKEKKKQKNIMKLIKIRLKNKQKNTKKLIKIKLKNIMKLIKIKLTKKKTLKDIN